MRKPLIIASLLWISACGDPDPTSPPPDDLPDAGQPDASGEPEAPSELFDELSMPAEPTLSASDFEGAQSCARCHPDHVSQWRSSAHAYAMVDPVYRALVKVRQADLDGREDRFCLQCHSAIATRGGEITPGFTFEGLSEIALEGVTCEACHKISSVERPYNAGHTLDPRGPMRGPLSDPAPTDAHESASSPLFQGALLCGSCHDVIESDGLHLERPYAEWLESEAAEQEQPCQRCHMPTRAGKAATDGPDRPVIHEHRFVGVDLPLVEGFIADPDELETVRAQIATLLGGAAELRLAASPATRVGGQVDLQATITNRISAHSLPTGTTFIRQLWLEITVTDAQGAVIYQTGHLDEGGDLRDHFSSTDPYGDPDLITLGSSLVNAEGSPEIFSWRATEHTSTALSPRYSRTYTLFIPTTQATLGPLQIEARLRFRSHPPYLLRALGLADLVDQVPIHDIARASLSATLLPE